MAALAVGLLLRCVFVWFHPRFAGDTLVYADLAHNMLRHGVYGLTEGARVRPTLIRLPGYPLFLAACALLFGEGHFLPVVWVQVGVDLLGCWLLGRLAERLFGEQVGLVCVWLAALCPFTANYAAAVLTETLSIFCVVVGFWAMERWLAVRGLKWALAVGAASAAAVLLRPDGVLMAGVLLPGMAWVVWRWAGFGVWTKTQTPFGNGKQRLRWQGLLVAAAVPLVCLGFWTARNWRVYHVVQPLAPKYANDPGEPAPVGFARWYRTWGVGLNDTARVYWEYDGSVLTLSDLPQRAFDSPGERRETERVYRLYNAESSSTPASERAFDRLATERIRAHPVRYYVGMPLLRLGDMLLRPRTEMMYGMPLDWWQPAKRPVASWFALGYGVLNAALLACAVAGAVRWGRLGWGVLASAMVGYVLLRSGLLMTIDNSEPRYVLEYYPVVLLMAAVALGRVERRVPRPATGRLDPTSAGSIEG